MKFCAILLTILLTPLVGFAQFTETESEIGQLTATVVDSTYRRFLLRERLLSSRGRALAHLWPAG